MGFAGSKVDYAYYLAQGLTVYALSVSSITTSLLQVEVNLLRIHPRLKNASCPRLVDLDLSQI